jgi:integrase
MEVSVPHQPIRNSKNDKPLDTIGEPVDTEPVVSQRVPSYRRHKASGQAVVTIAGRDIYLGAYGSAASKREYRRHLSEWVAAGCPSMMVRDPVAELTVAELILRYWHHAKTYYKSETRDGTIAPTLRRLRRLYGPTRVAEFGPLALKAFRQSLLDERDNKNRRLSRGYINKAVQWVRRVFRWGVSEQLVEAGILHSLGAVEGLKYGRTPAPETEPVTPVADSLVEATLPFLPVVVADMVRVQRLTGMRPGEVCAMTVGEIDTSGEVWLFSPRHHKTAHHGKSRVVPLGPRTQAVLQRYLKPDLSGPVFSPAESERARKAAIRAQNRTPFTPSRLRRDSRRAARPRLVLNPAYTTANYAQAIRRACETAGVPHWTPNQLRHSKATELRKVFGLDGAGAVLGHSKLETTQIYAERSAELASRIALATG